MIHPHTQPNFQSHSICRQAFGVTLADATIWQATFWLDDAARGKEAAESLELACRALPGALVLAPLMWLAHVT